MLLPGGAYIFSQHFGDSSIPTLTLITSILHFDGRNPAPVDQVIDNLHQFTTQKSNIDTNNGHIFFEYTFFPRPIIWVSIHVSFRGFLRISSSILKPVMIIIAGFLNHRYDREETGALGLNWDAAGVDGNDMMESPCHAQNWEKTQQVMLAIVFHTSKYIQSHSNTVYPNVYIYIHGSFGSTTSSHHQVRENDGPKCMIVQLGVRHMCIHSVHRYMFLFYTW